jgi:hypothetical protein
VNRPRAGLYFREATTVTADNGGTVRVSELTGMSLHGIGMGPYVLPASRRFGISVTVTTQ